MNDLNLLEKLSESAEADRAERQGRWLLIFVVLSGIVSCIGLPPFVDMLLSNRGEPFFDLGFCLWGAAIGIILAIPFLTGVCFSLLDAPSGIRIVGIACSLIATVTCLALGLMITGAGESELDGYARNVLPVVPAMAASITLPFVTLRYLLGWQIVVKSWNRSPKRQQVSISGMMIGTFVVGICLAGLNLSRVPQMSFAMCAIVAGVTIVFIVPFSYAMLRSNRYWGIMIVVSVVVFLIGLGFSYVMQLSQKLSMSHGVLMQLSFMLTAAFVWLGLGLIAIRLLCGKLVLHRDLRR